MDLDAIRRGLLNKIHQTAQSFKANTLDKTDLDERIVSNTQNAIQRFSKPSQNRQITSQNFKPVFQTRLQNVKPVNYANVAKTTLSTIGSQPLVRSPLIGLETPQSIPRVRDLNPFTQSAEQAPILGPIRKFFREGAEQSVQNYTGKPFESQYDLGSPQRYAQLTQAYMGTPEGAFDIGLSIGGGSNAIQKNLRKYTTYVKNNFDKETLNKIGYFSELVERGIDKGELGSIGQEIQAIANDVFGKQANGWTNRKIKNAFDLVLGKVAARENPFGLGLAVNELQRKKNVANAGLYDTIDVFHGGRDLGDSAVLKRGFYGGDGKNPTGQDSGAIFFTDSEKYARQYSKTPDQVSGLYKTRINKSDIFDITNPDHRKKFIDGAKKWEGYDSPQDAINDAKQILQEMEESTQHGAIDWATGSQYIENIDQAGFKGVKFLERPAENIQMTGNGYKLLGDPVYSYAMFSDEVPVSRVAQPSTPNAGLSDMRLNEAISKATQDEIREMPGISSDLAKKRAVSRTLSSGDLHKRFLPNVQSVKKVTDADIQSKEFVDEFGGVFRKNADIITLKDGTRILSDLKYENGKLFLAEFAVSKNSRGKGAGSSYVDWLKSFADNTESEVQVYKITQGGKPFWEKHFGQIDDKYGPGEVAYTPRVAQPSLNDIGTSDKHDIQELRNAVQEGRNILRTGSIDGRKLSQDELLAVSRSVENAQARIGAEIKDGATIQELSYDQLTNRANGVSSNDVSKEGLKKWKLLVSRGEATFEDGIFRRVDKAQQLPKSTFQQTADRIPPAQGAIDNPIISRVPQNKQFNLASKLDDAEYKVFNDAWKREQRSLMIDEDLMEDLPRNITGKQAFERMNSTGIMGEHDAIADDVVENLRKLGYTDSAPKPVNLSSEGTKMKSGKIKVRNFPTQTEVKNRAELNAGNPDLYTQRKAKLMDNADEDTVNLVREAIDSGDIQGARALHQDLSNEFRMPQFEQLVREIDDARNQALSGAKQMVGEAKKDEYQEIMGRMKQLLKQKGESPNGEGTLYREHIPAKDLGQSSDEVADALGMTESELMQELAQGIQMRGKSPTIKINTKQSREMAKLDKSIAERKEFNQLYQPVMRNGQLVGVSAEMSPQAQSMLRLRTQESIKKEANKAFNEWQKQVFRDSGGSRSVTGAVNDLERVMRKSTRSSAVRDFKKLKDISSPAGQFKDIFRNFKTVYGDRYEEVKKQILDPLFIKGKNDLLDDQEQWIKKITDFENEYGIRKGSQESADVQKYGEGLIKKGDLIKKYGAKKADQIVKADEWFRANYDQLLTEVNRVRKRIYPNNPERIIPKRKDYYRHFNELSQGIDGLLNTLGRTVDVSPNLAGISYRTKPKSKWLSFAQRRLGEKTEYDAVGGFIDYVKAQTYAKHIDPHINTFRQLSEELGEEGIENNRGLNNFSLFLQRFADDLSGKTNVADRFVQETIGRKPMAVLNWINSRVKANTILGNVSSTLAQAFNLPNGIAEAGPKHAVKGINRALASIFKKNRPMDQSTFLRERYFKGFDQFERGMINDGRKLAAWMITALDEASSKAIWNMQYEKALTNNISDPIAYADDVTRRMVGGRGIGEMPLIQRSKVFQLAAPFQLEVTNAWHVIGDMIGERAFGKLMTLALTSYVMNRAVERVRGSDVSFDPINAVVDGVQAFNEEENKGVGVMRFGGRVGGEVLSNTPIVGQVVGSIYPEYGNKEWGLPAREQFFGEGDPTRYGSGLLATKGLQDPLFKLIPPYGGQQLKRTLEGIGTSMRGYSETPSGNVRFPIENNLLRDAQRAVFGQYSTPEARQYFDEDRRPLGENQTQDFLASSDRNAYYDQIISNRESENLKEDAEARLKGEDTEEGFFSGLFGKAEASDRLNDLSAVYEIDTLGDEPKTTLAKEKWEDKRWDKAVDIYNNSKEIDGVTEEEKQQLIEQMGVSYEDVAYYDLAKQENRIKSIVVREQLDEILSTSSNREDMLQTLAEMRKQIRGKEVLAPGVIDDLVDEGYISYAEGKELKKISFDKDGNPKVKVSGRGRGAKLKKVKFVTPKLVAGNIGSAKKSDLSRMRLPKLESISPNFSTPNLQVPNIRVGNPSQPVFNVRFDL